MDASDVPAGGRRRRVPSWMIGVALLTLLVLGWAGGLAMAMWSELEPEQREALLAILAPHVALVALFVLMLPLVVAWTLLPWMRAWPRTAARMRDEVAIAAVAHSERLVEENGPRPMRDLARAINALVRAHAALQSSVAAQIAESNARLAEETRRLAALMSELPQGVLVCNRDGRILLYNAQAAGLLERPGAAAGADAGGKVGLGRSVFGVIDRNAIAHAWGQATQRAGLGAGAAAAVHFVTTLRDTDSSGALATSLLRVRLVPILGDGGAASGFVLLVDDITRAVENETRRDALLVQLTEGTRAALGNLRAAAQTLQQYPSMDDVRRARFVAAIHDEAERLAQQLGKALADSGDRFGGAWPREDMQAGDLVLALQQSLQSGPGLVTYFDGAGAQAWLHVESHSMVQALTLLMGRVAREFAAPAMTIAVRADARFARIELQWQGDVPLDTGRLHGWEAELHGLGAPGRGVTVQKVFERHGAESWAKPGATPGTQMLCVQLPLKPAADVDATEVLRGRPVYYDFDLFNQRGQTAELDETPLTQLAFTVFDTETTGLRPSEGDEIISIGAVRIVNGKLLEHESFDRLTHPRRPVSESAQAVHGISDAMLEGQPPLEEVLPEFARYCEDTVLVAHNAAFDMRFLELASARCGVRFDQAVLDTLLLSEVVHPGHEESDHALEKQAARLGVSVIGRHTALGDAIVTAEVFLRLLPLLAERGINTLGEARAASRRTALARVTY